MRLLVIGYGSIGRRHAANARALGHEVVLLRHSKSRLNNDGFSEYYSYDEIAAAGGVEGAIVCSPTSMHMSDIEMLVKHRIPFLLEKPPATDYNMSLSMEKLLRQNNFKKYDIGFNLRYYPALQFIKNFLPEMGMVYSARIAAGYYLPYWRKDVDYRQTSSASRELGGGVHIELVHEIDYLTWFFGPPESVSGYISRVSDLEISTEDICSAMLKYGDGSLVELHLDYLSHSYLRGCRIIADNGTLEWEMNSGRVSYTGKEREKTESVFSLEPGYDFNQTYIEELKNFTGIIDGRAEPGVTITEAAETMRILEAIKVSSEKEKWVYLEDV